VLGREVELVPDRAKRSIRSGTRSLKEGKGMIFAHRESNESGADKEEEQQMTIDAATRLWRGCERLGLEDFHEKAAKVRLPRPMRI
jgi:hypothetical protein